MGEGALEEVQFRVRPPKGRQAIFLGDLVDRGPKIPEVLGLVMSMVESGAALCVPGNHDMKLVRYLRGRNVHLTGGLAQSAEQLQRMPGRFREQVAAFLESLVSHYVLDGGQLVAAHAGMKESLQGRSSGRVREFALYGETTGKVDERGLPERLDWAAEYRGKAKVVYGHTPVAEARWRNGTINIDTGCVFGGALTALRYPEMDLVSVPAARAYAEPARLFLAGTSQAPAVDESDALDLEDVSEGRTVETRLLSKIVVSRENATAALEVMNRTAAGAEWFIYAPPVLAGPSRTRQPDVVEHPAEAFDYYGRQNITSVICLRRPRSTPAVLIVWATPGGGARFGLDGLPGVCYSRTGQRLAGDDFLERAAAACRRAGLWERSNTDWACIDGDLAAGLAGTFTPSHLWATEAVVHTQSSRAWHMETLAQLAAADSAAAPAFALPSFRLVDVRDAKARDLAAAWWQEWDEEGGAGIVVRPLDVLARGPRGLAQPGIYVRGPRYLRSVGLGQPDAAREPPGQWALALRQFALGQEALERFVRREPVRRVHECVMAILALESAA